MNLLYLGMGLVLLGVLPAAGLYLAFAWIRKHPQVSTESVLVPANNQVIRIISPEIESRYEYRLSGVVVVGDNQPEHTFDFYLLRDRTALSMYKRGIEMPPERYQYAQRVIDWRTYIQTGPGSDFVWVLVNPHPYELQIHVKLDYYPTPAILRGISGKRVIGLAMAGILISLVGVIVGIVGLIVRLIQSSPG